MKPLVLYHANCADGFGAAWVVHTKNPDAEFVPCQYGKAVVDIYDSELIVDNDRRYTLTDRDVIIVDFSFPKDQMLAIHRASSHMVWLDHHRTAFLDFIGASPEDIPSERYAQAQLEDKFCTIVLDNQMSGAMLAWRHFYGFQPAPDFLEHIQDRDLWRFNLTYTREVCLAIKELVPEDFDAWGRLADFTEYEELKFQGRILTEVMNRRVERAVNRTLRRVVLRVGQQTYEGLAANVVNDISEIGGAIAEKSGTYALTFFVQNNEAICSLRSIGDYDVSLIAKAYGGGGHKNASGFKMPVFQFFLEVWS